MLADCFDVGCGASIEAVTGLLAWAWIAMRIDGGVHAVKQHVTCALTSHICLEIARVVEIDDGLPTEPEVLGEDEHVSGGILDAAATDEDEREATILVRPTLLVAASCGVTPMREAPSCVAIVAPDVVAMTVRPAMIAAMCRSPRNATPATVRFVWWTRWRRWRRARVRG
jgi:hypothetical protein